MKLKLLKGDPRKLLPQKDVDDPDKLRDKVHELYRALALTVVPTSEWWVPLRYHSDPLCGSGLPTFDYVWTAEPVEFCDAWDRLEAQVGLCLSARELPAAAWYTMKLLDIRGATTSLLWEDTPYNSRMWVRTGQQGHVLLPIPRDSAIESALHAWWALSGGFLNYEREFLALYSYGLEFFPFYSSHDQEVLRAHPSKTVYRPDDWRDKEHDERKLGCLWREGLPISLDTSIESTDSVFDWATPDMLHCPYGLKWVDRQRHRLHPSLLAACADHRKSMYVRAIAEGKVPDLSRLRPSRR